MTNKLRKIIEKNENVVYFFSVFFDFFLLVLIFFCFFRFFFVFFWTFFFSNEKYFSSFCQFFSCSFFVLALGGVAVFHSPVWWCCLPSHPLGVLGFFLLWMVLLFFLFLLVEWSSFSFWWGCSSLMLGGAAWCPPCLALFSSPYTWCCLVSSLFGWCCCSLSCLVG